MKNTIKLISLLLSLLLVAAVMLTACGNNEDDTNVDDTTANTESNDTVAKDLEAPDYYELDLSKYVKLGSYKGLVVDANGTTEGEAVFEAVVKKCEIIEYPESALNYYLTQTVELYKGYAKKANMSYDELMKALDLTEEDLENEAKNLIKKDLIAAALVKAEGLELTDNEKENLFDKYASVYMDLYDYTKSYIQENLSEEIYDSMQYDKLLEYLVNENFFIVED